jgi:hypothetical protein
MNVCSIEFLGTDQALGEQNGDLVAGLERHGDGGANARNDIVGMFCSQHDYPHRLQHRFHRLAHGELPGITLAELAPHRDQRQQREAASLSERQHIDAVPDARGLHQQHGPLAAEVSTRDHGDAFLFGGQRHRMHVRIVERPINQHLVSGIGNITKLGDVVGAQQIVHRAGPGFRGDRFGHYQFPGPVRS